MRRTRTCRGFTLVELLVVIGIIALLISILLPALNKARQQAVTLQCLSNMRQLVMASMLYADSNNGAFPPLAESADQNFVHFNRPSVFPTTSDPYNSCYLTRYLSLANTSQLYTCPTLALSLAQSSTGLHSYLYNRYIGGMPDSYAALPIDPRYGSTGYRHFAPYRIGQIKQSSNFAVFTDSAIVQAGSFGNAGNALWFRENPASDTGAYASPHAYQYPAAGTGGLLFHQVNVKGSYAGYPTAQGLLNAAFADGSARSTPVMINNPTVAPIDSFWVQPAHPTPYW